MTVRGSPPWLLATLSALLLLLDWAWFVRPGATYVSAAPQDFLQFADLMHRMATGQIPHVDFHAPMGWLAFALPYAGFLTQGGFAGALEAADMFMLAALLPLACVLLAGRAPTWASVATLVLLFGLIAAPWRMGESGWRSDPGLHYNQWGWAILSVTLLLGLRGGSRGWRLMAVAAAMLLSLALFTKITHFLACLGFVALFGIVLGEFRRAACWGLALCGLCALCVHLAGGWVDDYAKDIMRTARVALSHDPDAAGGFVPISPYRAALDAYGDIVIVLALGAFAALSGGLRPRTALHGLFTLGAGAVLLGQDAQVPDSMPAVAACIVRLAADAGQGSPIRKLAALALCLHLLANLPRQALAGLVFTLGASGGFPDFASGLPRMGGVWFGGAGVTVNAFENGRPQWRDALDAALWGRRSNHSYTHLSSAELLATLRSGVHLLQAADADKGRVMTFDFGNPFPALLNAPPPKGVLFSMFVGRQADRLTAADPKLTLGDADWLMVPKFPVFRESAVLLLDAQSDRLAAEWLPAAENEHWRLLRRHAPDLSPVLLRDAEEMRTYVEDFPFDQYMRVKYPNMGCKLSTSPSSLMPCLYDWWMAPIIGTFWMERHLARDAVKEIMMDGGIWEPHVIRSIQTYAKPGSVAIDAGAFIGGHSMLMGRMVGDAGRVYAFEPQPKVYRELVHNIALSGLQEVVVPLRFALGEATAVIEMDPPAKYTRGVGDGSVEVDNESAAKVGRGGSKAEMRPLDDFGFLGVSLIKIDVEGYEDAVLAGASKTIAANRPVILLEIDGQDGYSYPGVEPWGPWGGLLPATPEQLERIHATWRLMERHGYRVRPDRGHDYVALPLEHPDAMSPSPFLLGKPQDVSEP